MSPHYQECINNLSARLEEEIIEQAKLDACRFTCGGKKNVTSDVVESKIFEKHQRLKSVLDDADKLKDIFEVEKELEDLRKVKAQLHWQLLLETSKTLSCTNTLVAKHKTKMTNWRQEELEFLTSYLQVAKLKSDALQGQLKAETYGPQEQETLRKLGNSLQKHSLTLDQEILDMETKLQQLKHLPPDLVEEFARLENGISERKEYIQRLG